MVSTRQSCNGSGGENNEATNSNLSWSRGRSTGSASAYDGLNALSLSSLSQASGSGTSSISSIGSVQSLCSSASSSGVSSASSVIIEPLNLLDMPPEILEKIFSYVGYHSVAQLRLVCMTSSNFDFWE